MEKNERLKFERNKAYRLVRVDDKAGRDKIDSQNLYKERIGCVAVDFQYYDYSTQGEENYKLRMKFIQTSEGLPCNRPLITSQIEKMVETENGVNVITQNSIYIFERVKLAEISMRDASDLIELYMSIEDDYLFGRGFYYDNVGTQHELEAAIHVGMFQDSVLICFKSTDPLSGCVGRYFPCDTGIEFYNTIFCQHEYSTTMLIHNTGKKDLTVHFPMHETPWTIKPGESQQIVPYRAKDPE